ncbi:DUF4097 family beta strand repeat protein [Paenibacillus sp. GSMTC-2017]|uniref:DUF4097 family beta strand repeat-containing protein n=1 Tax=Paenibacillus sp. GSMTC-2017 TaxID=2794350 RepID=UPI0018D7455E|nr:DUF4097 family beta strand repeat-containing protein [Paenibacillus sp. GSMTC-2017]MBH5320765.1 DUF4097 family beta strand repeat protein [Paenibacillus sp. GSMTC-2017]
MKKRSKLGTLLVIIGIIGLVYVYFNDGNSPLDGMKSFFTSEINDQQTADISKISNVNIKSDILDVQVVHGNQSEAVITVQGLASKSITSNLNLTVNPKGDTLEINLKGKDKSFFGFDWNNVRMTVELPEKDWNILTVATENGDIKIDQLVFNDVNLQSDYGDINTDQFTALTSLTANVNSGDLHFYKLTGKNVDLKVDGDVYFKEFKVDQIDFDVDRGDVAFIDGISQIHGVVGKGDITIKTDDLLQDTEVETDDGDIYIQLKNKPSSLAVKMITGSGDTHIGKDGFIYEEGSAGSKELKGAFGDGHIKLSLQSNSGDIALK